MGFNHGGDPEHSMRTGAILRLLQDRGPVGATTWEIQELVKTVAASTGVADLRKFGWIIDCTYEGKSENGQKVYRYTLKGREVKTAPQVDQPSGTIA